MWCVISFTPRQTHTKHKQLSECTWENLITLLKRPSASACAFLCCLPPSLSKPRHRFSPSSSQLSLCVAPLSSLCLQLTHTHRAFLSPPRPIYRSVSARAAPSPLRQSVGPLRSQHHSIALSVLPSSAPRKTPQSEIRAPQPADELRRSFSIRCGWFQTARQDPVQA